MRTGSANPARFFPPYKPPGYSHLWLLLEDTGPHLLTVRVSFTVPTGYLGWLGGASAQILRKTSTPQPGRARLEIQHDSIPVFALLHMANTVGATTLQAVALNFWAYEGTAIEIVTEDLNAGGTLDYSATVIVNLPTTS